MGISVIRPVIRMVCVVATGWAVACAPVEEGGRTAEGETAGETGEAVDAPESWTRAVGDLPPTVAAAIEAAGGWSTWMEKRDVDYLKSTERFDEEGNVESKRSERHRYLLHDGPKMHIEWEEEGRRIVLVYDGRQAAKWVDGELRTEQADRDHAWNSTTGSHYMFGLPFKLADRGAVLTELDESELRDGTVVTGVEADYEPGAGTAGGMHTWRFFFDASDLTLAGIHLRYGEGADDRSHTEITALEEVEGILVVTDRSSYGSNEAGERLDLRSRITLSEIDFDSGIDASLFAIPAAESVVATEG